ncbi:MAG: hypothetical protein P4L79_10900 [Legionella sp.]|uniref:hypothetical protein n=1 Tax=Legionella sp. TaxID=459 RepID=UPI00284DB4CA|nr:hypothetical protein [Legionella sp.]
MRLSVETIKVLKNFSQINPSLIFKPGTELRTTSPTKTIIAIAQIEDEIIESFAIGDLSRFLSVLSLFNDPELVFSDKLVTIKSGSKKLNYTYASESVIVAPPWKELNVPSVEASFELTNEVLMDAVKGASILGLPQIAFVGDGEKVTLQAIDQKNSSGDVYSLELGTTNSTFKAIFKVENINLLPGTYQVELSKQGISKFASENVTYFVAVEQTSTFE